MVVFENWCGLYKVDHRAVKVFLDCLVQQNLVQSVSEEDVAESTVDLLRVRLIYNLNQVTFLKLFEAGEYLLPWDCGGEAGFDLV